MQAVAKSQKGDRSHAIIKYSSGIWPTFWNLKFVFLACFGKFLIVWNYLKFASWRFGKTLKSEICFHFQIFMKESEIWNLKSEICPSFDHHTTHLKSKIWKESSQILMSILCQNLKSEIWLNRSWVTPQIWNLKSEICRDYPRSLRLNLIWDISEI